MLSPEPKRKVCFINGLADTNRWLEEHCVGSWSQVAQITSSSPLCGMRLKVA
jgi:hypothetical protein